MRAMVTVFGSPGIDSRTDTLCRSGFVDVYRQFRHPGDLACALGQAFAQHGALGYWMRRFGFPVTPMIVGAILGPLAKVQLRRALDIAGGDLLTLVSTQFTIVGYLTLLAALVGGYLLRRRAVQEVQATESKEGRVDETGTPPH